MLSRLHTARSSMKMFLRYEYKRAIETDISFPKLLWYYRHGFLTQSAELYDFESFPIEQYLSDLQVHKSRKINQPYGILLDNKLLFRNLLSNRYSENLTELIGYISGGRLTDTIVTEARTDSLDELVDNIPENGLICKPNFGSYGKGIFRVSRTENEYRLDDRVVSRSEVVSRFSGLDEYLLEERIQQADYSREIYPGSVNTIRILTMIDPETKQPFVGAAAHRFGTVASSPADNLTAGGVCADVDIRSGRLSSAVKKGAPVAPTDHDIHPDTGTQITEIEVPGWDKIRESVLDLTNQLAEILPYIGWDIAVTDRRGSFKILEANTRSDVDLLQLHRPLLEDDRVREFYDNHGIV